MTQLFNIFSPIPISLLTTTQAYNKKFQSNTEKKSYALLDDKNYNFTYYTT